MIFVPKLINNYTIDRDDFAEGGRHYNITLESGEKYHFPSMTTILHQVEPDYIKNWKKRVGKDTADSISRYATDAGTSLHEFCESVLLRDKDRAKFLLESKSTDRLAKFYMKKILPYLKNINKVYASEEFLFNIEHGVAGTVDGVVEWNGKKVILDFKTANMPRSEDDIESYYVQVAGYSMMWKYLTGDRIDDTIILLVNSINVQVIERNVKDYEPKFRRLVDSFYEKHGRKIG